MNIYILEEQKELSKMISYSLRMERENVETFCGIDQLIDMSGKRRPDLIILYEGTKGSWATDTTRKLKNMEITEDIPVIVLSNTASEEEISRVLDDGAELFLRAPVGNIELYAYIHAVMRRINAVPGQEDNMIQAGQIRIFPERHQVFVGDREIGLLPSEFQILTILAENEGSVMTSYQIARDMKNQGREILPGTVKSKINSLRHKIPNGKNLFHTVRGVGYKFDDES